MSSEYLENVRRQRPVVHTITNYVTANDCANLLLAAGASPIMADAPEETAQIAAMADAVVLNLGTLSVSKREAMLLAGKAAAAADRPIVLDPVGVGTSDFRRETAKMLLAEVHPTVIRGNRSEIRALLTGETGERGVDTADLSEDGAETARLLAKQTGAVVMQTGETDLVTDGEQILHVQGGNELLVIRPEGLFIGSRTSTIVNAVLCAALLCSDHHFPKHIRGIAVKNPRRRNADLADLSGREGHVVNDQLPWE